MPAEGIPITELADLLNMTQKSLDRGKWTDISYDLQEHVAVSNIIGDNKVELQSGTSIQFNVVTDTAGTAEPTRPHHPIQLRFADVTTTGEVPWRADRAHYTFSELEMDLNRPPEQIVNMLKIRENGLWVDCAQRLEPQFWGAPTSSTNTTDWFGIKYWCPKWVASVGDGRLTVSLQGGNPTGFTSGAAGISSTTYPQWNNWAAQYLALTEDDGVGKMSTMYRKMQFRPPPRVEEYNRGEMKLMIAANETTVRGFEKFARSQNDSLGFDIIPAYNGAVFYKTPISWVPYLDADTGDPIYFIDYSVFKPVFLSGWYMKLYPIQVAAGYVETMHQYLTWVGNFVCYNRRRLGVLSKDSSTGTST